MGRRLKITPAVIKKCLEYISTGGTVREFCRENNVGKSQMYRWIGEADTKKEFLAARRAGEIAIIGEMQEIADTRNPDDPRDIEHRKLQLWMREKRLIWSNAEKYGTKNTHQHKHAHQHLLDLTPEQREQRIQELLAKARAPEVTVEVHKENGSDGDSD